MEYRDIPIDSLQKDEFDIAKYVNALCSFIRSADTPITIALQGEWGSGKSSFMKIMESDLCNPALPESERFDAIWLNTWDLFLENDYEAAVKKLILSLMEQIEGHFEHLKDEQKAAKRKDIMKKYLKSLSSTALSVASMDNSLSEMVIDKVFSMGEGEAQIGEVKKKFEDYLVKEIAEPNNGVTDRAFIIFVDDLDRLEPKMAVTLLEALKNLFDLRCCLFVLAIDYEIVEYGVQQKYGEKNIRNRNIAKDFFDKLIQVSYVIPMSHYHINKMVMERLRKIEFFDREYEYVKFEKIIVDIITNATNKNPRAIKRLLNMIQLAVALENPEERHHGSFHVMELFLMAMQLSFPTIYDLLTRDMDLESWERTIHLKNSREITEYERVQYQLDEPWKEIIYIATEEDEVLRKNYYRIANLLDIYEKIQSRCRKVDENIHEAMGIVNVVSIHNPMQVQVRVNGEDYEKSSQTQYRQGEHLIDTLELSTCENVLDVGCGNGKTTLELWQQNLDMKIDAFDISEGQIRVARENYEKYLQSHPDFDLDGSINFYVQDVMDFEEKEKYDLVFSNATLHWIMKPNTAYGKLYDALLTGGQLAVHQGGKDTYKELHEMARKAASNVGLDHKVKKWLFPAYYPEKEEMRALLQEIGFEDISVESIYKDESSNEHLVDNFARASLIYYRKAGLTEEEYQELQKEYFRLCSLPNFKMSSHRLYIHAKKP